MGDPFRVVTTPAFEREFRKTAKGNAALQYDTANAIAKQEPRTSNAEVRATMLEATMHGKSLFSVTPGPRRWVNLPFVLGLLIILVLSGGEEQLSTMPYMVLLPLFTVQLIWPTRAGWVATLLGWMSLVFGVFAYARFARGITAFDNWFLLEWGIAPSLIIGALPPKSPVTKVRNRNSAAPGGTE